ncbi:DUF551 domain-containing protein [Faecalicoccus pleomorphus]|uniref:DUF551 domain-containing protein n=1 Tax=Faecalicoccus pleomorphus TaxID=1323 RepID=UPI00142F76A7
MIDREQALEIIDKHDFFNDRAGRELWNDKPKEIQDEDIISAHEDYEALKEYILNQPKAYQWIPCSERLPEEQTDYKGIKRSYCSLVTVIGYGVSRIDIDYTVNGIWHLEEANTVLKVLAWQPLPKSYEVKE